MKTGTRGYRLGLSERRLLLKTVDLIAVTAAWWLLLRPLGVTGPATGAVSLAALALLWLLAAEGAQAYPPEAGRSRGHGAASDDGAGYDDAASAAGDTPSFLTGTALVAGGMVLLLHAAGSSPVLPVSLALPPWPYLAGFVAGLVLLPGAFRVAVRPLLAHPRLRPRVLVVGREPDASAGAEELRRHGCGVYRVVGGSDGGEDLARRIEGGEVDVVALANPSRVREGAARQLDRCVEAGIDVVALPVLLERLTGRVPLDHVESGAEHLLPLSPPAARHIHRAARRTLDLVLVALGLAFFLPVLPLVAAAIRLETPGPVFYTQERVGRGGWRFRVYKLRSMVADAEAAGTPRWATENDPRITRVGRFLRATHLDEFPQMLNILKGEMSPVGPRPERPEFVEELAGEIPHYRMRHAVRPGMAGWALVEHGYASSPEEARRKHEYDLYYVKHQSLWLDLVVLARTLVDTFTLGGR